MRNIQIIIISVLLIFNTNLLAKDKKKACDASLTCLKSKLFFAQVAKTSKRGNTVIVQIIYTSININSSHLDKNHLNANFEKGYALLLDASGNEFKVEGKSISNFEIQYNQTKVMSLRFKGTSDMKIMNPFDITIKGSPQHGEISFFDLGSDKKL